MIMKKQQQVSIRITNRWRDRCTKPIFSCTVFKS